MPPPADSLGQMHVPEGAASLLDRCPFLTASGHTQSVFQRRLFPEVRTVLLVFESVTLVGLWDALPTVRAGAHESVKFDGTVLETEGSRLQVAYFTVGIR